MPKSYTVKEVADILGYSTNSIYTFLKEKRINGVRVGRGRFRIPETELARVLHLSKKSDIAASTSFPQTVLGPPLVQKNDERTIERTEREVARIGNRKFLFAAPNFFDWFVGLSAIVSGLGLLLFNVSFEPQTSVIFVSFLPAVVTVLICCGIGTLISKLMCRRAWSAVFLGILVILGGYNALMFLHFGDIHAAFLYGGLSTVILVHLLLRSGGVFSYGLYISFITLASSILFMLFPNEPHIAAALQAVQLERTVVPYVLGFSSIICVAALWLGYRYSRLLFWISCLCIALASLVLGSFFTYLMYWSRGYFVILIGFFTAILPVWRMIQSHGSTRQRVLLHGAFFAIGALLILSVVAVRIVQDTTRVSNERASDRIAQYTQAFLEQSNGSARSSLVTAAQSPILVSAMEKGDVDALNDLAKVLIVGASQIRRIVFLDADGTGLLLYPTGTFTQKDLSAREYFVHVRQSKEPYISNSFQPATAEGTRYVVSIAVPILSPKQEFLGVLVGSLDLESLGFQLQKLISGRRGESIVVIDGSGKTIIDSDPTTDTPLPRTVIDEMLMHMGSGGFVSRHRVFINGRQTQVSYMTVPGTQWITAVLVPLSNLFRQQPQMVIVFGLVLLVIFSSAISFLVLYHHAMMHRVQNDSP